MPSGVVHIVMCPKSLSPEFHCTSIFSLVVSNFYSTIKSWSFSFLFNMHQQCFESDVSMNKVMFSKDKVYSVPACKSYSVHEKRECHWRIQKLLCILKSKLKPCLSCGAIIRWLNACLGWNVCPPLWTWSLQGGTDIIHGVPFKNSELCYLDVISYYDKIMKAPWSVESFPG
jgi:hypothetical protein